jgi:thymidylate synthase
LEKGERVSTQQGEDALMLMAPPPLHFRLENGFPLITERNMAPKVSERLPVTIYKQAIGEIFAFINGCRTISGLNSFGCFWWHQWATEAKCAKRGLATGDLGPGSYGGAFAHFPTTDGGNINQWEVIVEQMKQQPQLRTHCVSPWIPDCILRIEGRKQKVVVVPCHGWVHIRIINGKLTLHMQQRSADLVVGVPSNIAQYAALTMALAQVTGYSAVEYIHSFSDCHIYVNQIPAAEKMLSREPRRFPTMFIDPTINNLFDFRHEHFQVGEDYNPHPGIKDIPVAI